LFARNKHCHVTTERAELQKYCLFSETDNKIRIQVCT